MNCRDVENLLSGYLDGELDLVHSLEVEEHLSHCAACSEALRREESMSAAMSEMPRYRASRRLRQRVQGGAGPARMAPWLIAAACLALALVVMWRYGPLASRTAADVLAEEIVQDHVRSLQANHLLDMASSSGQAVKPWFAGKLGYAPDVQDLSEQGFRLAGGRLDYVSGRAVAALVYERDRHVVNVFVWPSPNLPDRSPQGGPLNGFHAVTWRAHGMTWWAVSDLSAVQLEELPLCPCFLPANRTLRAEVRLSDRPPIPR
jgi:anti-sigma factor RsiW